MSVGMVSIRNGARKLPTYGLALLLTLMVVGAGRTPAAPVAAPADASDEVGLLLQRAHEADDALQQVAGMYAQEVAPIEAVLRSYRDEPALTREIAVALVREAHRANLEPRVLLSVLLVENPMLEPNARSFVGAVGLMQVMPLHRGNWRKCQPDLESIESNICHGAQIFASYLRQSDGDIDRALLRYNGCVRGTNTPNCQSYPTHVYARAGRATLMAAAR